MLPGRACAIERGLTRGKDGKEYMVIKAERGKECRPGDDARRKKLIEGEVKKQIIASCEADICCCGELPRSEKKTKRIFDKRDE